jgi:uncharacterized protein YbjT (DUF2867 family)
MKILVSGATGYVGSRLIPRLVASGHEVSCMVRDASRVDPRVSESTRTVVADALQPESIAAAMQGIDGGTGFCATSIKRSPTRPRRTCSPSLHTSAVRTAICTRIVCGGSAAGWTDASEGLV